MQDVTNVLYECLGRVTHIQNELERQQRKISSSEQPVTQAEPSFSTDSTSAPVTVDGMMAKLERISTLTEIGG